MSEPLGTYKIHNVIWLAVQQPLKLDGGCACYSTQPVGCNDSPAATSPTTPDPTEASPGKAIPARPNP